MTLEEIKSEIEKYQYFEDTNVIDVSLASIIATRLKLGDPIWLVIVGASSGGKSQILRPLALTDEKFIHRVDDLTENTFLSGSVQGKAGKEMSLLKRIGPKGIIVVSDLTVLFSKTPEQRATILSQFRMLYDGEMIKHVGNKGESINWKGYLGVIGGSTPSIYGLFEEVSEMGERFMYWRMKDFDSDKAVDIALNRKIFGKELDDKLSDLYAQYIHKTIKESDIDPQAIDVGDNVRTRIKDIANFAELARTAAHVDWKDKLDRIPVPAKPMRVALQLITLAKALYVMRNGALTENDLNIIDWCAYSLANEEKRACLKQLAQLEYGKGMSSPSMADIIGIDTDAVRKVLQNMAAVGILKRTGTENSLAFHITSEKHWELIRRVEKIQGTVDAVIREITSEERDENQMVADKVFDRI